ncbi:MAG: glycosyltransferase family 9 protein [Phycisphaerae bacterium]
MSEAGGRLTTPVPVVLHGGALGDLLLLLSTLLRNPGIARGGCGFVSRVDPGLERCRPAVLHRSSEGVGLHWLFAESTGPPSAGLRALLADRVVINALGGPDSLVHQRLLALSPKRVMSIDARPDTQSSRHITEVWGDALLSAGFELGDRATLSPSAEMTDAGRNLASAARVTGEFVAIHPGSGGRSKCWPLGNFMELAREVVRRGRAPLFVIGPAEVERWHDRHSNSGAMTDVEAIQQSYATIVNPTATALAAILAAASSYFGNDSGPTHLAALLGTRCTALFGPTNPEVWAPRGPHVRVIRSEPLLAPDWGIPVSHVVDWPAA